MELGEEAAEERATVQGNPRVGGHKAEGSNAESRRSHRTSALGVLDGRDAGAGQAGSLELPENQVHLWVADHRVGDDELDGYAALLDPGERQRASRFRFHKDFRRFVFGHARLRLILGLYSGEPAGALQFARRCAVCGSQEHGKPFLLPSSGGSSRIRFNCSYSDHLVVVAVSNGAEVGVDVERVVPGFAWREVAETALSPGERSIVEALDDESAARAFFGIWTRKEAASKASGEGLTRLTEIDTCRWTSRADGEFEVRESSPERSFVGKVLELPEHEGAVAVEGASAFDLSVEEAPGLQVVEEGA